MIEHSTDNVGQFLSSLALHMRPFAEQAIEEIRRRKRAHLQVKGECIVQAWDQEFYLPSQAPAPILPIPGLSIGLVFVALSRLFNMLYGITLRPSDIARGEVWSADVRKLEVVDEDQGILGYIYTDLYSRRGKPHGAAHFTVQCSRLLDTEDFTTVPRKQKVGFGVKRPDGVWQLPIVALLCGFHRESSAKSAATLEWAEVQTLFHEMGHAIHCEDSPPICPKRFLLIGSTAMIGRTQFHNVSGTRCATDFCRIAINFDGTISRIPEGSWNLWN